MAIIDTVLKLEDLPPPPKDKTGWPWTEQVDPLPAKVADGSGLPRVSIITTSYNQGMFLEETMRSVILQGYPNIEYVIIDGGSVDNTLDIIKKYKEFITYSVSEQDLGQSQALNKGFRRATGELIGWQNSDDYYGPGSFFQAADASVYLPEFDIFYGSVKNIDTNGRFLRDYPVSEFNLCDMLPYLNMCNQSMFFKKKVFEKNNFVNELFRHAMDQEFFIRLAFNGYKFKFYPGIVGYYRVHENSKGSAGDDTCSKECLAIYRSVYKNSAADKVLKNKALSSIHGLCLQSFERSNLDLFYKSLKELFELSGFQYIDCDLMLKYLLGFLGADKVRPLVRFKNFCKTKSFMR